MLAEKPRAFIEQGLSQPTESEAANGKSSLLVTMMDYDTIGYKHSGKRWVRQICRIQQEKLADWCRIEELSGSMDLTLKGGNQLKGARRAAWNRDADEIVLVKHYTGIRAAGRATELLGLAQGRIGQVFVCFRSQFDAWCNKSVAPIGGMVPGAVRYNARTM